MFLTGAASRGTAVPARARKAAADTKEFLRLLKIIIRSYSTVLVSFANSPITGLALKN
jgi:hypothetical protein